jgi:outer membrane protein OmpA-like peptidoglycan-associated protein
MKKYILVVLMFVFGLSSISAQAQQLPAKKRQAIEQTMYQMDYTKALETVNTELQTYPEDYDLNLFKAICCSAIPEHSKEAVAAYEKTISIAKTDCEKNEARYYFAKYYCELGQKAKSLEIANTILTSEGTIDDCSLEMVQKLSKSACMSKCDDTEMQNEIAKVKKTAAEQEEANKKKMSDLNKKISDLEKQLKEAEALKAKPTNGKNIADPSQPISADAFYKLHFAFNKSVLDAESKDILDRFVTFLKANPDVKVACIGHADMVGTEEANDIISRARAMNAKDYLTARGIKADRINVSYKGNSEPEVIDEFLVKKHTEFKVGEELTNDFINNLTGAKKAKANYLNRRVELRATR